MQGIGQLLASSLLIASLLSVLAQNKGTSADSPQPSDTQRVTSYFATSAAEPSSSSSGAADSANAADAVVNAPTDTLAQPASYSQSLGAPPGHGAFPQLYPSYAYKLPVGVLFPALPNPASDRQQLSVPSSSDRGTGHTEGREGGVVEEEENEGATEAELLKDQGSVEGSEGSKVRVKRGGYTAPYFVGKRSLEESEELEQGELQKRDVSTGFGEALELADEDEDDDEDVDVLDAPDEVPANLEFEPHDASVFEGKRQAPMFVGKRKLAPLFVGRRRAPFFIGKRRSPLFVGKRRIPMFVGRAAAPMFVGRRQAPMFVGKRRAPMFVGKRRVPMFVGKRRVPMFVGKRRVPMFVGKRRVPMFVGKRRVPIFVGKRLSPTSVEQRAAPMFVGKRLSPTSVEQRAAPMFVGKRPSPTSVEQRAAPMFVGKRLSPTSVEQRAAPMFVGKRLSPTSVEQRAAPMFVGKRRSPMFVGKRKEEGLNELLAALHIASSPSLPTPDSG